MKQKQQLQNCESFELKDARFSRFYDISYNHARYTEYVKTARYSDGKR